MCLDQIQTTIGIIQAALTSIAIVIGGIWTYRQFIRNRQKYSKLSINHLVYSSSINKAYRLIRVTLNLKNHSQIKIKLCDITLRLLQVDPWPDEIIDKALMPNETSFEWPLIEERIVSAEQNVIEPNEDDNLYFDFIVGTGIKKVIIYSHIKNKKQPEIGWNLETLINLDQQ